MKKLFVFLMMVICTASMAQNTNANLPPDEVTIVDHVVKEGENLITIYEDYGQKFKLKEFNKYNSSFVSL